MNPSRFEVFEGARGRYEAVKLGFSWPAFFFTWLWAFAQRLWGEGVTLAVVWGLTLAAAWLQGSVLLLILFPLAVALVAGWRGNVWRARAAEKREYAYLATVEASASAAAARKVAASREQIPLDWKRRLARSSLIDFLPRNLRGIGAVAQLTLKAAVRFRFVLVVIALLFGAVVLLPLVIKDDSTARGFTQIVLTYTLSAITALLGFATLWLACGTLARDIEESQMQMVAVKPIPRWQIWMGKLAGLIVLNAILLSLSAGAVYVAMLVRMSQLPEEQRAVLRNEVLVARGSAAEGIPDLDPHVEQVLRQRLKENPVAVQDLEYVRRQIREQVRAQFQVVPPGYQRPWTIDLGPGASRLKDQPLFIRIRFNAAEQSPSGTYLGLWEIGDPATRRLYRPPPMSLAADTYHEFQVPGAMINDKGQLLVRFVNQNNTPLLFPLEEGFEVLYRVGGFGGNFVRGVAILFFWLVLLAAIGLAAASFLSFPVASFFSLAVLMVGLSSGVITLVLEQGTILEVNHETGLADAPAWVDHIALPIFRALLTVINLVRGFSPIDSLSTGRSITFGQLGLAFFQICIILGGLFAFLGIATFNRRELATAQT